MSATQTYFLDCGKHQILTLDADEHGNYLALLDNGEVWSNHWQLPLRPRFRFPLIRRVDARRFVVVEAPYAYLFTTEGKEIRRFEVGRYYADVLVHADHLVVSYIDQGAAEPPPDGDGLAVFDLSGQQRFGYNGGGHGWLLHCYAMCPHAKDRVLFYAYTDFDLQELSLTDFQLRQWPTPPDFAGSHALTASRDNVIFWGSYEDKASFFWWDRQRKVTRFGHAPVADGRGLGNGKFLLHDARSFTIIDALELMREEARQRRG